MLQIIKNIPDYNGMGVYSLTDEADGKRYIGSSKHIQTRIKQHEYALKEGYSSNSLKTAYKNGHTFKCEILEKIEYGNSLSYLLERETYYVTKFNTHKSGLNARMPDYIPEAELKRFKDISEYHEKLYNIFTQPIYQNAKRKYANDKAQKLKRVPLDLQLKDYERVKAYTERTGETVNGFIKRAIREAMKNDE